MRLQTFLDETVIPQERERVFSFFSNAENLQAITPAWLNFVIVTPCPIEMRAGAIINYKLRVRGLPFRWKTEITEWEPPRRFVDVQRHGPYRQWVHEHTFEPHPEGTLMRDRVEYAVPGGWLVDRLFVRRDVEKIFRYRKRKIQVLISRVLGVGPGE